MAAVGMTTGVSRDSLATAGQDISCTSTAELSMLLQTFPSGPLLARLAVFLWTSHC